MHETAFNGYIIDNKRVTVQINNNKLKKDIIINIVLSGCDQMGQFGHFGIFSQKIIQPLKNSYFQL